MAWQPLVPTPEGVTLWLGMMLAKLLRKKSGLGELYVYVV